ncbi:transporter substrate-binding domain-containing protein, partial [Staphylococcus aureus]|uniref:transporter substrate-binding domain-containing protein n=1 Tax=Staphylococcus aureus TaxID=1280 RepID=UPI00131DFEFF
NIQVRVRYYESYQLLMQALAAGEVDLIANASVEDKQKYGLLLTHPYINASPALVERTDSLLHGTPIRRVGIESLYRNHKALIGRFPEGSTQVYDSSRRALEALSFNNLDAYIGDAISARYLINQANLNNLRLQLLPQEGASGFSFGVDKSNSRLQRILN